jgi:phage/plasmid-associated DNA primase
VTSSTPGTASTSNDGPVAHWDKESCSLDHRHRRDDLITKLAPVIYNPKARDAVWEKVLDHATGGDADYAAFLARALGYCASGDTSEEVLFFACKRP